jgi:endonuclease/exonuclease/phosphatase family metal-dependent hydrolase
VTWIVNVNADVVSLNEVERQNGYNDNADEPAVLEAQLESRTGVSWYGCFAQRDGAATGQGNLVLSRIRIESCDRLVLSASRSVAGATLSVNNVIVTTHLDDASASTRATQIAQISTWAATAKPERLLMGDFNAGPGAAELEPLRTGAGSRGVRGGRHVDDPPGRGRGADSSRARRARRPCDRAAQRGLTLGVTCRSSAVARTAGRRSLL